MAEAMQHSSTDELATIPYEVIRDKTLNTHDHLYKLIIIGDSCKSTTTDHLEIKKEHRLNLNRCLYSCWKKLPVISRDGRGVQGGALGDNWRRVRLIHYQAGRQDLQTTDLGYCGSRVVPLGHTHLLQGRSCCLPLF